MAPQRHIPALQVVQRLYHDEPSRITPPKYLRRLPLIFVMRQGSDLLHQGLKFEFANLGRPVTKTKDVTYSHGPASLPKRRPLSHLKFDYFIGRSTHEQDHTTGKATQNLLHLC
ncbi:hypothetical protein OIU76_002114 [Salix suchowensis]|uniref:Ribosomal protein S10 n=1 Tax=Salix suchowensis TaxID=1278906 RepID=A0ABQ9CK52_9ROSI|nr:hypothetical protein OIU76_002114 [Salix suchowensis]KAJ6398621.1 hypothetical protein OIU77_019413 [Salix suchowensis]